MILAFEKYPNGQSCPIGRIVATIDKCKHASAVLGLTYVGTYRSSEAAAGCHWENRCNSPGYEGCHTSAKESQFNAIVDPSQTNPERFGATGGVCVKGRFLHVLEITM